MPRLIDSHCHLQMHPFDPDRGEVLGRMRENGIWAIAVGTGTETSRAAVALAEQHPDVWATVGHHPEHLTSAYRDPSEGAVGEYRIEDIETLARSSKRVVAIGETGLDFFRIDESLDRKEAEAAQERAFLEHLSLARDMDLPVVIHCRDAFERLAEILRDRPPVRGVVHCFSGNWDHASPLLDLGLHMSFTGIITFPPRKSDIGESPIHQVLKRMPLDRLLVETDAPWLAPVPHRGKRNEPTFVAYVADAIAGIRGVETDEIKRATTENAIRLFRMVF
ncbi:TatD family hydrolase [Candidatus Uhrbacteria bacterium]|nr:TatD family hydrolase [Candidatus Uhrbacteria bacterium]